MKHVVEYKRKHSRRSKGGEGEGVQRIGKGRGCCRVKRHPY